MQTEKYQEHTQDKPAPSKWCGRVFSETTESRHPLSSTQLLDFSIANSTTWIKAASEDLNKNFC